MADSKLLPSFTFDVLCYFNREELEQFSIVGRRSENFIKRFFNSMPYRIFDALYILGRSLSLYGNQGRCYPYKTNGKLQQFLGRNILVKKTTIYVGRDITYSLESIAEMESLSHLWRNQELNIYTLKHNRIDPDIVHYNPAEYFLPILNSPTILQCQYLYLNNFQHFAFKDYDVLYSVKIIHAHYRKQVLKDFEYWSQFIEKQGVKPLIVLKYNDSEVKYTNIINYFSQAFLIAFLPNAFRIVFAQCEDPLTEFQETNKISGEKLELKKGIPTQYNELKYLDDYDNYTLERSCI